MWFLAWEVADMLRYYDIRTTITFHNLVPSQILEAMYFLHRNVLDMSGGNNLTSRDVSSGSTRSPLEIVFVGCILGFAFLAFVMYAHTSPQSWNLYTVYLQSLLQATQKRNSLDKPSRYEGKPELYQRYSDWKRTHSRSMTRLEDHSEKGNMPSEWERDLLGGCERPRPNI
ncbi:hypothetical protein DL98DRAFT_534151 [Cadophora sp. DSE1049]|nr:hypothetical protein DL98DRAFT_534151 [Cadophora sp. DSE1049]